MHRWKTWKHSASALWCIGVTVDDKSPSGVLSHGTVENARKRVAGSKAVESGGYFSPAELVDARKKLGLSRPLLSCQLGIGLRSLEYYENGAYPLPLPVHNLLCRIISDAEGNDEKSD